MLTLLTATGCRPVAWATCERWMMAQTYKGPVRWVIVDDGEEPQPVTFAREGWTLEVIRPLPYWSGKNTQARNLREGMKVIADDARLAIVEDDDYYAPDWLDTVDHRLGPDILFGESHTRYYSLPRMTCREMRNDSHASLCATAMHGKAVSCFRAAVDRGDKFIDLDLWRRYRGHRRLIRTHRVVGIKGLPGRTGIGIGHKEAFQGHNDASGKTLIDWVGSDAAEHLLSIVRKPWQQPSN